jgi:hypothetical protein
MGVGKNFAAHIDHNAPVELIMAPTAFRGFPVGAAKSALITNRKKIAPEGSRQREVFQAITDRNIQRCRA